MVSSLGVRGIIKKKKKPRPGAGLCRIVVWYPCRVRLKRGIDGAAPCPAAGARRRERRQTLRGTVAATLAAACLLFGIPAHAQDRGDDGSSERQENRGKENFALAVGAGLAEVDNGAETYLTAALRIRISGGHPEDDH